MESQNEFSNLKFKKWMHRRNKRLMIFIISLLVYLLCMWIFSASTLVTILLFIVPVLIWIASYGWRTAITRVIRYLGRFLIN